MSFEANISSAMQRVAAEFNAIRAESGDFTTLTTTAKNTLVAAINEVAAIANAASSAGQTAAQVQTAIDNAIAGLVDSAPGALDTLAELATALGGDANFAATITNSLALKANIADTYTRVELGDPTTDYVPIFEAALT